MRRLVPRVAVMRGQALCRYRTCRDSRTKMGGCVSPADVGGTCIRVRDQTLRMGLRGDEGGLIESRRSAAAAYGRG